MLFLGIFLFFQCFFEFFGVLIIQKWLIKVPGPIAILFRWLLELRFVFYFYGPFHFFSYYQHISKNTRRIMDTLQKILSFSYITFPKSPNYGHHRTPTHFDCCVFLMLGIPPTKQYSCPSGLNGISQNTFGNILFSSKFWQTCKSISKS